MSSIKQPLAGPRGLDRSHDDLDGLLRAFFRADMPEPWPVLKPPAKLPSRFEGAAPRRRTLLRSRFALAASLLLLLIGQLFLSGLFPGYARFAADSDPRKIEATKRYGPVKAREPKRAPPLKKPEAKRQPLTGGVLISGRS